MVDANPQAANGPGLSARLPARWAPGLALSLALAGTGYAIAAQFGGPALLYALVLGIACSWLIDIDNAGKSFAPGADAGAKLLLRIGVVLLGARVTLSELGALGAGAVTITLAALASSLAIGIIAARLLRLDRTQAFVLAGATAICGASAAMAIAAALPRARQTETAAAIAGVTIIGAICMLAYPALSQVLGFDDALTGIFLGATLHEVAQAVGAGFSVSPEAGEAATAIKLLRVACLGPVILLISRLTEKPAGSTAPLPWFVIGFLALATLSSFDVLPESAIALAGHVSQWLLLVAIAALGLKTSPQQWRTIGLRPFALITIQTLLLAAAVAIGLILFVDPK